MLDDVERSVIQILFAYGIVEDCVLEGMVNVIHQEHSSSTRNPSKKIKDMFRRINTNLNLVSLNVKSVVVRDDENDVFKYYHGIANIDEDKIAIEYGTTFSTQLVKFFTILMENFIDHKTLSTGDIHELKPSTFNGTMSDIDNFVSLLELQKWIKRNDRGYYEFGYRSYLELKPCIENIIDTSSDDSIDVNELKAKLPQVILY